MEKLEQIVEESEEMTTCCEHADHHGNMPPEVKEALLKRMSRIEGQVRGIKGMIDRDVYCDDILNQMSAVQSALKAVSRLLLDSHMKTCVLERLKEDDTEVVDEFLKTVSKLMK
jgi:DNA-binding FrmR family transcriptional regulator